MSTDTERAIAPTIETIIETILLAAILAIIVLLGYVGHQSGKEFDRVCQEAGGVKVYDGRQNICFIGGK